MELNYLPPTKYDNQRRPAFIQPKPQPWISKLGTTVHSFKENMRQKFDQLMNTPKFSLTKPSFSERSSKPSHHSPKNQAISRIGIISSPVAAVFASLITSLGIASLAFTKELVFGETILIPGQNSSSSDDNISTLTSLKLPFVSAIYALSEVVTSGIQSFLNIPNESSDKRYRETEENFIGKSDISLFVLVS